VLSFFPGPAGPAEIAAEKKARNCKEIRTEFMMKLTTGQRPDREFKPNF
jgi:hypothetical protein